MRLERLLLLWDEMDELLGYGRHMAVAAGLVLRWRKQPLTP
ncbi:MAG: hypothetical protein ABI616_12045 [Pseudomonadota bacterium]